MRNEYKRLLAFILCLIMIFASVSECFAASKIKSTTVKLSSTSGTVTVKNASGKKQTVKEDMNLYSGYTIKTGKDSYAYVALDKSKAVKIDSLSEIEIRKSGRKLELYIIDGSIFCNVEEKLKSDESLNIRTNTMITGIRGTSVQFDVDGKDFAAKFFDGSGESVDLGTGKKYKIEAGSKFVGGESADGAQGLAKMDNILDELSASAAEEIQGNEELAARIAKTFDTSTTELVNDIKEALPEMKAADQKAQEEKIKELEAAEKASSVVDDALKKSQVAKESEEKSSSGSGSGETKPVTPTPTPVVTTTYAINLPDDVATYFEITNPKVNGVAVTKSAVNEYEVEEGATFTCTVTKASGLTLQFSKGTYSSNTYSLVVNADTTVTASATVKGVNAIAIKNALNSTIPTEYETVEITLPADTANVLTFTASGSGITTSSGAVYTVIKGTDFGFTVSAANGVEFTASNAGTVNNNYYHFTADTTKTITGSVKLSGVNARSNETALTGKISSITFDTVTVTLPNDVDEFLSFNVSSEDVTATNGSIYTVIKGGKFEFTVATTDVAITLSPSLTPTSGKYTVDTSTSKSYTASISLNSNITSITVPTGDTLVIDTLFTNDKTLAIKGNVVFKNGFTNNSNGTITINSGSTVTVKGTTINNNIINVKGQLILDTGSTLTNNGSRTIFVASGSSIENKTSITNDGIIRPETETDYLNAYTIVTGNGTYSGTKTFYLVRLKDTTKLDYIQYGTSSKIVSPSSISKDTFTSKVSCYDVITSLDSKSLHLPTGYETAGYHWFTANCISDNDSCTFLISTTSEEIIGKNNKKIIYTFPKLGDENSFTHYVVWAFPIKDYSF